MENDINGSATGSNSIPTVVLLPGMDGTGELFGPFRRALGTDVKVLVVSYPRDVPLDYLGLEQYVRTKLPRDEPFFLLGESFSGPVAISIAASKPSGLIGLILCSSFARMPRAGLAWLRPAVAWLPVKLAPVRIISWLLMGRYETVTLRAQLAASLNQVSSSVLRARVKAVLSVDVTASLREVEVPVLYLQASDDWVVSFTAAELISQVLPDVEVQPVEAPHFLLQVAPDDAVVAIRTFVKRL